MGKPLRWGPALPLPDMSANVGAGRRRSSRTLRRAPLNQSPSRRPAGGYPARAHGLRCVGAGRSRSFRDHPGQYGCPLRTEGKRARLLFLRRDCGAACQGICDGEVETGEVPVY